MTTTAALFAILAPGATFTGEADTDPRWAARVARDEAGARRRRLARAIADRKAGRPNPDAARVVFR